DFPGRVRMRVGGGRRAMRRPARVRDAGEARQRLVAQLAPQIGELALGAAPLDRTAVDRRDARRIISAIFEPLERVEQPVRHRMAADDTHDSAHGRSPKACKARECPAALPENPWYCV